MALTTRSASFSSIQSPTWGYEVFVSFHGDDTRTSFTDHLFAALKRREIRAFRDNREIERGKDIWTELERAIEMSSIAVIVFSRNYTASPWCLDELAKINECRRSLGQIVLPVFYYVRPSELRALKENLAELYASRVERFGEDKLLKWRDALTEVINLAGWDSQNVAHRYESELIENVIKVILNKLNFTDGPHRVGIGSRMEELNYYLHRDSDDVCMIGIWTKIAQFIYDLLKGNFKGCCILGNLIERLQEANGLIKSQGGIFYCSVSVNKKFGHVDEGTTAIIDGRKCKKVLLVIDGGTDLKEFHAQCFGHGSFQAGSRTFITGDERLLNEAMVDLIYKLPALNYEESLLLFSWHAFGKFRPDESYVELSKEVLYYARGLPLVLKVLGSCLFGKSALEWKSALKELKESHYEIFETHKVSFHSLSDKQKKLFLKIALNFIGGMEKNYALRLLQDSDISLESELRVLGRRCLVTVDCSNRLTMHDIIKEMGREIVRRQYFEEPGEYSGLWSHEDGFGVSKYHMDRPSKGKRQRGLPYFHENMHGTKFFEDEAPFEHFLRFLGIPTMTSMSQSECLRSLLSEPMLWEKECQLLRYHLEKERRAHLDSCESAARASGQQRDRIAALESENIRLHKALVDANKFAPQLYMDLSSARFEFKSAACQCSVANVPEVSTSTNTPDLDYVAFLDSPVSGIQSFNEPSRSTPPR